MREIFFQLFQTSVYTRYAILKLIFFGVISECIRPPFLKGTRRMRLKGYRSPRGKPRARNGA